MTSIYFVRHAQPMPWEDDRTRPLSDQGAADTEKVFDILSKLSIDYFFSSPYKRSVDTIASSAAAAGKTIKTDERFIERRSGSAGITEEMIRKRWADFNFCELGGENIQSVQDRNMSAILEILGNYKGKNIVVGTHGTALSTILHNYDSSFGCEGFFRIFHFMPYIIRLDFDGFVYVGKEELLIMEKGYVKK